MTTVIFLNNGNEQIELDAMVQASPSFKNRVTKNRVESGADIADHVTDENLQYTLSGIITNADGDNPEKHATAFDRLVKATQSKELLTIQEQERVFTNLIITSFNAPIDAGTGQVLKFTLNLEQIRTAQTQTVKIDVSKIQNKGGKKVANGKTTSAKDRFTPKDTKGKQNTIPPSKKQAAKSQSLLSKVAGFLK